MEYIKLSNQSKVSETSKIVCINAPRILKSFLADKTKLLASDKMVESRSGKAKFLKTTHKHCRNYKKKTFLLSIYFHKREVAFAKS